MNKKTYPLHPLLFALFPTLFLYSRNILDFPFSVVFVPLGLTLGGTVCGWLLLRLVWHDTPKTALICTLFLFLFFSYGHVYEALWHFFFVGQFTFGAEDILLPLFAVLFVGGALWVVLTRRDLTHLTRWANIMGVILVCTSVGSTGLSLLLSRGSTRTPHSSATTIGETSRSTDELPDIYYIILDGFARADVLTDLYDYPQSRLYEYLQKRGFFVAERSGSNYCQTMLSVSSSLNYKYLKHTEDGYDPTSKDRTPLNRMVINSRVVDFLSKLGYRTVAFATGSPPTELRNADVFLEPAGKVWFLDEFQNGLLTTTPLPQLIPKMDHLPLLDQGFAHPQANARRELILRTFDLLEQTPPRQSPKFVFCHLVTPHPPFLFGPRGEERDPPTIFSLADGNALVGRYIPRREDYMLLYRDQLKFVEKKIIPVLEAIITNSTRPPVIILQSDHGPGAYLDWSNSSNTDMRERLGILNAYYLPDGGDSLLYDTITPVNSFRVVFNHYFDAGLPLLPDESYFSLWEQPYSFMPVGRHVTKKPDSGLK